MDWKHHNDIPNHDKVEGQIDLTVLEPEYDNYVYDKKNNGMSFWKMLFMPPKYHKLVDNKAIPYIKFQLDK